MTTTTETHTVDIPQFPRQEINADRAIELLRKVVEEFGRNHIVDYCRYANANDDNETSGPNCIVGQVLAKLGLSKVQLKALDNFGSLCNISVSIELIATNVLPGLALSGLIFSPQAIMILDTAQASQDNRSSSPNGDKTWGHALDKAEILYQKLKNL